MEDHGSGSEARGWLTVERRDQAKLLSDQVAVSYLTPFLARERSASEAARELGVGIDTLLYRIRTFLAADLLEIVDEVPRAGRPIKIYRSVADGFFVPFELTDYAEVEEQARASLRDGEEAIVRAASSAARRVGFRGRVLYRLPDGEVMQQAAGEGGETVEIGDAEALRRIPGPAYEAFSAELQLTDDDSKDLLLELYALYDRYRQRSAEREREGRGRSFVVRFQLAADDDAT